MHSSAIASLTALLLTASGLAELKWDNPIQQFKRTPQDESIDVRFTFHNAGDKPIAIRSLRASCGCTTPHLEKKTYAPGEAGEVLARFIFGDRKGPQRKTIEVRTDEDLAQPYMLDLRVLIHDPLTIEPMLVWWKKGEPAAAKAFHLTAEAGQPVHVKRVSCANPRFAAKLEALEIGGHYVVSVTPSDTAQKESGEIFVLTDFPADAPRTYIVQARVK